MKLDIIDEEEEFFIIRFPSLSGKKIEIPFTATNKIDTIMVKPGKDNLGYYNVYFRQKAIKNNIWNAVLCHEALHCIPEFIAPIYGPSYVLPELKDDNNISLIPNSIEDIAINHTLWLWEENPIRSSDHHEIQNITEKLLKYFELFKNTGPLTDPAILILEYINKIHFCLLNLVIKQRKGELINKSDQEIFQKTKFGDKFPLLTKYINQLLNSRNITLNKDGRYVELDLNIKCEGYKNLLYETRYNGIKIPQYVSPNNKIVANIYDILDEYYAEFFDIDVKTLRKKAYNSYKEKYNKIIKNTSSTKKEKNLILEHKITNENKIAIIDFSLKYENEKLKITNKIKQKSVPHKTEIKQNMLFSEKERLSRFKRSELYRLKKWVE